MVSLLTLTPQTALRPDQKPNPTVEFDTPEDCKGKFPEYYRTRSGMMVKVWCLRDHRGNDFATLRVKSWAACAEVCSWKRGCIAFSFEGEAGKKETGNCWLKKAVNQIPPKSSYIWSGTLVNLEDIPADKRKQWGTNLASRQPDPAASEPYRPWFSTGMPEIERFTVTIPLRPKTTMMTTMVRKDGSGFFADTPGFGGFEVTLSDLALETSGFITDGPKATNSLQSKLGLRLRLELCCQAEIPGCRHEHSASDTPAL